MSIGEIGFGKCNDESNLPSQRIESRFASLLSAQELYKKGKNDFIASLCEEQHRLLKCQQKLEQKCNQRFVDLSLRDTIKTLLLLKENKLADGLRTDFKVSEKMYGGVQK